MYVGEGKIPLKNGHRVWYRRVGDGDGIPLLVLHGGPGAGHDYLEPLENLAEDRPVVFYDQLGCGKSDQPNDRSLWRMERFLSELDEVREALGLNEVHLFGHSSGGMMTIDYMLSKPGGVASLILADSCASMPQLEQELKRLKSRLPREIIATLDRFEARGDFQNPKYREAVASFYKRHVCRLSSMPDCLRRTTENLKGNPVYETMNGPNELTITGNLKDWDRSDQLGRISVPTLILVGRHDELTPACSDTIHQGIAGSKLVVFEKSSHIPHIEEGAAYLSTVSAFLSQVDKRC
ncbi:proline iminopeptidase-family hydrolase [Pontiellaceae bacterium B1224]|nr:proline iminopeptidase-family hydrolase [Pontiellaceae bacterium B1224]